MICRLREWQRTQKNINDFIVQASIKDGSDSWTSYPIGMSWQYAKELDKVKIQFGSHENLVLCAINDTNDLTRRPTGINRKSILENLGKNNIHNEFIDSRKYYSNLASYKFVISPEGNGIDCHRHYEALLAGCIPILEHNDKIQEKYNNLPIVYTKDYSEINNDYLQILYDTMLDKTYDFSKLFKSYYTLEEQKIMNDCSSYWVITLYPQLSPHTYFNSMYGTPLVWITLINYGYIDYTKNFLKSMEKHGCSFKLIVYCLDKEIIEELQDYKNAVCFDASFIKKDTVNSKLTEWFSMDYKKIVFSKLDALKYTINLANKYGVWAVGYIDTDIIVINDPIHIMYHTMLYNQDVTVFSQCDEDVYHRDCSNPRGCPHICSGVIVFRTGAIDISVFDYTNEDILKYSSDQEYLLYILNKKQISRLTISKNIFLNGSYPGVKGPGEFIVPASAFLVHYNYMTGNEKQGFMKKNLMWYL